jgi:hypothetical protein
MILEADMSYDIKMSPFPLESNLTDYKLKIYFYYDRQDVIIQYLWERNTFVDGLAKVGGLLAVFKISLLLFFFHEKLFEKSLENQIKERLHN